MNQRPDRASKRLASLARHFACVSSDSPQLSPQACSSVVPGMLRGKVAIVTGGGNGIGEATCMLLASQGAAVSVCDLDGVAARKVRDAILSLGGIACAVEADITSPSAPARVVAESVSALGGRLDILVNNAGYTWDGTIHKMPGEQWDAMLAVHVTAPFRLIQAAAVHMREGAKREMEARDSGIADPRVIVNISSTSGTHGNAGQANYAAAKAGIIGLTKAVAKEWGPFNIRCNAVAFGLIDTRLTRSKESGESIEVGGRKVTLGIPEGDAMWEVMQQMVPLRRKGSADDAAGAIMMLVSPWAAFITGQVVEVDGGMFT